MGVAKIAVVLSTLFLISTATRVTLPASYVAELDPERPEDSRQATTVLPVEKLREDGAAPGVAFRTIDLTHRPIIHQYHHGPHFGVRLSRAAGDEEVVVPYGDDMILSVPANEGESNAEVVKEEEQETVVEAEGKQGPREVAAPKWTEESKEEEYKTKKEREEEPDTDSDSDSDSGSDSDDEDDEEEEEDGDRLAQWLWGLWKRFHI
ncbi:unnamed protein product [Musa textilis]